MRSDLTKGAGKLRAVMEAAHQIEQAIREDGRYQPEAFEFLHRGLALAANQVHGDRSGSEAQHVSGQQLCEALRELAIGEFGPLARLVLSQWGIHATRDFGEMVFLMIRLGLMGQQESDRVEDFDDVYEFREAFDRYQIDLSHLGG